MIVLPEVDLHDKTDQEDVQQTNDYLELRTVRS
jgi:hypothetical protein